MTWCLVCDLDRHDLCTGYCRHPALGRKPCSCPFHLQAPAPAPVYPPYGSDATAVLDTASGGGAGAGSPST